MNIKKRSNAISEYKSIQYNDPLLVETMCHSIISWLPNQPREYIILFIGTDRSTGDALGPLTGTLLLGMKPKHIKIYGTLQHPVHAKNLVQYISKIKSVYNNPYIIAVDACLGRTSSVGHVIAGVGPIIPGAALKKDLPAVGDLHLTGVVNTSGFMEFSVLQNTRLSLVFNMAHEIANILNMLDQQLTYSQAVTAVVATKSDPISSAFSLNK